MTDPHLDPIVATWDTKTLEDVREALQHIPMHNCRDCGWPYKSELAAETCCEPDMGPRD